ncbi:MAG: LysM peptidoglycan-binding domain-containing protein [Hyphomonadaceae bacterium]|nr:LysM peptidoglycan-binding domain-containing protein [Clostridia bacterium]
MFTTNKSILSMILVVLFMLSFQTVGMAAYTSDSYTVKSGDTLWLISKTVGVTIHDVQAMNGLTTDSIRVGQVLKVTLDKHLHTVKSGDTLWLISQANGVTISQIRTLNGLTSDALSVGQVLMLMQDTLTYTVKATDSLVSVATYFQVTTAQIKTINHLSGDTLVIAQKLLIPYKLTAVAPTATPTPPPTTNPIAQPTPVVGWPSTTYIVQAGDSASTIAQKFGVTVANVLTYNYMSATDWFNAGEKIAINGYAPRNYAVIPWEDPAPTHYGKVVDWFLDGQYVLKRNNVFKITDLRTGLVINVKMLGGYNHSDIEPLTVSDTQVMKTLFPTWTWTPRPVVVFKDGMNIAASLSGMPHSFDSTPDNGVAGHFDVYLKNSVPHGSATNSYIQTHYDNVLQAAGLK